ncbi:MAG: DUF839 domain-containing protein [Mariprofundus sp.]
MSNIQRIALCLTTALIVTGCGQGGTTAPVSPVTVTGITFTSTVAPTDQYAAGTPGAALNMSVPYTTSQAQVSYSDGTSKSYPLEHKMLFKSDDVITTGPHAGEYYGGIVDTNGAPVLDPVAANNPFYATVTGKALAAGLIPANTDQFVADTPDGTTLIQVPGAPSSATTVDLSFLNHFEYVTWDGNRSSQYGKNPMFIGNSVVSQDLTTGLLSMKSYDKLTFAADKGLWIPCAASKSPWNTHIGSEEYQADEWNFDQNALNPLIPLDFSNGNLVQAFLTKFKAITPRPYDYGYVTESTVDQAGAATTVKHYATGRWARELIKMMPDSRTYYSGDDGASTSLYMGVTDVAGDLSAVTLYAAKVTQTSAVGAAAGAATLKWIKLGHATDATIKGLISGGIQFSQIFDMIVEPLALPNTPATLTTQGYKRVFNYNHPVSKGKAEWLRIKPGMAQAAAFLETHRYAAYIGATSEFTKMEGVALNEKDKKTYIAMSYQYKSMSDGVGDIQFGLMDAGDTYELQMAAAQKDSLGASINSAWVATTLTGIPELLGNDNVRDLVTNKRVADGQGNFCKTANVANPDNLKFSPLIRTLFIGEDSNCHVNNYVWAFNVDTRKLSRILSIPMGAEATGLMAVDNMNGFSYIGSNYQHPGDNGVGAPPAPMVAAVETANPTFASERNRAGGIGYIHIKGMPRM